MSKINKYGESLDSSKLIQSFKSKIETFFFPTELKKQGWEPNAYIKTLRLLSKFWISLLRLNGVNRFSNEFIQLLDPKITILSPEGRKLFFRTGHGRLYWRARTLFSMEPMIINWIQSFSKEDCFFDIGANVGGYSIYAASHGVKTFAFEPEINNLQLLYENIILNQLQEYCSPVPIGVGNETKLDTFFIKALSKGDALHGIGKPSYLLSSPQNTIKVDVFVSTLDDIVDRFELPSPSRLKIDVDGNELQVIQGALKTISTVKEIYMEADSSLEEHRRALEILRENGFRVKASESLEIKWNPSIANYLLERP